MERTYSYIDFTGNLMVMLSGMEVDLAMDIGRQRHENNVKDRVIDYAAHGNETNVSYEINYGESLCAEWGLCDFLKVPRDVRTKLIYDAPDMIYREYKIDVKLCRRYDRPALMSPRDASKGLQHVDIYALATGRPPKFTYLGWAWAVRFLKPENIRWKETDSRVSYATYLMDPEQLIPMASLLRLPTKSAYQAIRMSAPKGA